MNDLKKQISVGAILSYLQMGLSIVIGLIYTPIMIRLLGKSEYGLYNTASSIVSMLAILSLGFNSSYIKFYAKYKKEKDDIGIAKLNGLFLLIFACIGIVALSCGLVLWGNTALVMGDKLTDQEYAISKVLILLLTISLAVSFPMSVFANIITAHEKFICLKLLGMIKTVLGPFVTLPVLLLGYGSIAMVAISSALTVFTDILYAVYVFAILKQKFIFKKFPRGLFKEMCGYTVFIAINMIVDQINWNIDKIVLMQIKGPSMVAVYSVGYSLYSYYMMFSNSIANFFVARVHHVVQQTEDKALMRVRLTELFTKVGRIQLIILGLIATGMVFFGKEFILTYWAGSGYEDAYWVALLLIIPSTIAMIQNLGIEIQRAENKHKFRSLVYSIMAIVNLVISIFLCQIYGAIGSAIGTAISLILANGIIMNIYYHKKCNIDIIYFWKRIGRLSLGMLIPLGVGVLIMWLLPIDSVAYFLLGITGYTLVYCVSMWFLGMDKEEKFLLKNFLKKFRRKKHDSD